jgi:hypothetical protein
MAPMAEDLLDRVVREIRERKERSRSACEESRRLEAALAALGEPEREPQPPPSRRRRARAQEPSPPRRAPRAQNRRVILEIVGARPGVTAREVSEGTGIAPATAGSTLAKLAAQGELERVKLAEGGVGFRLAEGRDGVGDATDEGGPLTGAPPTPSMTGEGETGAPQSQTASDISTETAAGAGAENSDDADASVAIEPDTAAATASEGQATETTADAEKPASSR